MRPTPGFAFAGPLFLAALVAVAAAPGCGQGAATCDTVCALPGATSYCLAACEASENACAVEGCTGDFQAWLTCVANVGAYSAVDGPCSAPTTTLISDTSAAIAEPATSDGGTQSGGSPGGGASSCATATCDTVCGLAGAPASCAASCAAAESECSHAAAEFQAVLTCLCGSGGWLQGTTTSTPCAAPILALDQNCAAFNGPVDGG